MRIERTKGVSDRIAKPRRGVSLRPVKEEPKKALPSPPTFHNVLDGFLGTPAGQAALRTLHITQPYAGRMPTFLGADFATPGSDMTAVQTFDTERIERQVREYSLDPRDFSGFNPRVANDRDTAEWIESHIGPIPEGCTREWDYDLARRRVRIADMYDAHNIRLPERQIPDLAPGAHYTVRVTYEAMEDVFGSAQGQDMATLPWQRLVGRLPDGVMFLAADRRWEDRTVHVRFGRPAG